MGNKRMLTLNVCSQGGVTPGCTLIINGGSGSLGSAAAHIVLAMGTAKVRVLRADQVVCEPPIARQGIACSSAVRILLCSQPESGALSTWAVAVAERWCCVWHH